MGTIRVHPEKSFVSIVSSAFLTFCLLLLIAAPPSWAIIDVTPPTTTAPLGGGIYASAQSVPLFCNDGGGSGCANIYYTLDGSTPTVSSTVYGGAIDIYISTTLKFFGKDVDGNSEAVNTESYVLDYYSAEWTRQMGTSVDDYAYAAATDGTGNVYVAGHTQGGLDGNTSEGNPDLFLVKYDSVGVKQWTIQNGTSGYDLAHGVATDGSGNIYVTGSTMGDLDGNTNAGGFDLFVVKYDSAGAKQWTRQMGTGGSDGARAVATDGTGNVYVAGETWGGLDGNTNAGGYDLFAVKYDSTGAKQWTIQNGTSTHDYARAVATDGSGNVYVMGETLGGLDENTNAGGYDLFVMKYDSSGVKQWTRQMGTSADDRAYSVATDGSGNVYVAGSTDGALDGNTNAGSWDLFLVKYDTSGVKQWTIQNGTSTHDYAEAVATDGFGNVYVAGYTYGDLDGNTNAGSNDLFVVKYDTSGVKQWTRQMGTSTSDYALGVATDGIGNIYVAGYTSGAFDGNTNAGSTDLFVVKISGTGGPPEGTVEIDSGAVFTNSTSVSLDLTCTDIGDTGCAEAKVSNDEATWSNYSITDTLNIPSWTLAAGDGLKTVYVQFKDAAGNWSGSYSDTITLDTTDPVTTPSVPGGGYRSYQIVTLACADISGSGCANTYFTTDGTVPQQNGTYLYSSPIVVGPGITAMKYFSVDVLGNVETLRTDNYEVYEGLKVLDPNGGEIINGGSAYTVSWGAPDNFTTFKLQYTMDKGSTWKTIATGLAGLSHSWTVPKTNKAKLTKCKIRVLGYKANGKKIATDTSDGWFTIQGLMVTSPNGGETLASGGAHTITWNSGTQKDTVFSVDIYHGIGKKTKYSKITTVAGNPGTYSWTMPVLTKNQTKNKIRVILRDALGNQLNRDDSDSFFSIDVLRVTNPVGGESIDSDTNYTVNWWTGTTNNAVTNSIVTYMYKYKKRGVWKWKKTVLADLAGNPGSYSWDIPAYSKTRNKSRVKLELKDNAGIRQALGQSGGYFTMNAAGAGLLGVYRSASLALSVNDNTSDWSGTYDTAFDGEGTVVFESDPAADGSTRSEDDVYELLDNVDLLIGGADDLKGVVSADDELILWTDASEIADGYAEFNVSLRQGENMGTGDLAGTYLVASMGPDGVELAEMVFDGAGYASSNCLSEGCSGDYAEYTYAVSEDGSVSFSEGLAGAIKADGSVVTLTDASSQSLLIGVSRDLTADAIVGKYLVGQIGQVQTESGSQPDSGLSVIEFNADGTYVSDGISGTYEMVDGVAVLDSGDLVITSQDGETVLFIDDDPSDGSASMAVGVRE